MKTAQLLFSLLAVALSVLTKAAAEEVKPAEPDPWTVIKDFPFEKRVEFTAGTGRMIEKLDEQTRKLNEKRATLPQTSVKDWDFAMNELTDARSYLKSTITALGDATFETWEEARDRVGRAWQRTQEACDKVKSSTTT